MQLEFKPCTDTPPLDTVVLLVWSNPDNGGKKSYLMGVFEQDGDGLSLYFWDGFGDSTTDRLDEYEWAALPPLY